MEFDYIKFDERGLVPAVAQEATTGEVLMLAYMNREALEKTLSSGMAHYYSRSREKLWKKGETSGNVQQVLELLYDCDGDTILLKVAQSGVACHEGERSCFFRRIEAKAFKAAGKSETDAAATGDAGVINELYKVILERKDASPDKSYVASLYSKGVQKIAAKVHEESAELINAARKEGREEVIHEFCDLWFHTLVLIGIEDIKIEEVFAELKRRFGTSGLEEKASRKKGD